MRVVESRFLRKGSPALGLAPMEGVTDAPMRALMTERGGFTYCVGEFLRVNDLVPPAHVFHRHIPELERGCQTAAGIPIHIQLLGGNPELLAESAVRAVELGAHAVDLNFGCPAPTVNRHDGGATLLKHPERIEAIVRAVRQAVPKSTPVSAKLRLGWDSVDPVHENAERAAMGGADWITIHARTRMQAYQPPVYWKPIGEVRERLNIPVVANGDIWTLDDFKRCREQTGSEHFMLGRCALADPLLPLQVAQELGLPTPVPSFEGWKPILERFAELSDQYSRKPGQQGYVVQRIKQWVRMSHQRKPLEWFDILKTKQDLRELFEVIGRAYELPEHRIL
jgi:tRNA-dihydrouridine synthase C